ncbi:MAG TPA: ATP-binding protein, partial [Polyangiales bacterium]|nr:ATP-binding protein [Polyangiales bacterium]
PIYDAGGHCEGFEGFITDVTARRRNDEARARLEDELSHSRRLEGLGRLASGITHDLNNWLTVIFANVEFAVNALHRDDPVRPRVEQIRGAAAQAASLTQQVLAFARKQRVQPRMVNLNTRVATIEKLSRRALPHSLQVVMRLDARLGLVEVDPGQIDQVLLNLIVNARDAMPPDGRLCLETQHVTLHAGGEHPATLAPGEYALVTVSDTGSGISEDVRERMFEPFFTTKPAGKGTGLGLASAHGIVRQARGEITFVSVLGCGTAFQIYLPRAGAEPAGHELTHAPELPRGRGELLLIVQPRGLERALRERGYRVLVASTHADALALAARHAGELSLVVMDAALERVPGAELPVPVLYLVGLAGQKPLNARPPAPGSRFLARPFTLLGLLDELRWLLEPPLALSMRPEPEAPFDRV